MSTAVGAADGPGQAMTRETYQVLTRARELLGRKRYDQARQLLAEAEARGDCCDPELAIVLQTRAYVEIAAGNYPTATLFLHDALALDALPPEVAHPLRFTLAQLYARQERYADAAGAMEAWLKDEPRPDAAAHTLAAQVYGRLQRFDRAIRHARQALEVAAPPAEDHYRLLLGLHLQAGRWQGAARLLQTEILVRYPDRRDYWRQLAALRLQLGQEERAAAALELARRRGLLEAGDLDRLVRLWLHLGAPLKAARLLQEALATGAQQPDVGNLRLLADAWQLAREPERALRALERAGEGRDLLRAGELLLQLERWPEAVQRLRRALQRGGVERPGRVQLLLGSALLRLQDNAGARSAFQAALTDPDTAEIGAQAERWLAFLDAGRSPVRHMPQSAARDDDLVPAEEHRIIPTN